MSRTDFVIDSFSSAGIAIDRARAERLVTLADFMTEYNKNVNLTAITDFEDVVIKHFVDSVLPFTMFEVKEGASFIDVGTGAGYPAFPLMIFRPDLRATLCDSLMKRCVYLGRAAERIGVSCEIIHSRAEDLGRQRRERYDMATARAVSAMPVLAEYCVPFVKTGGVFAALKSVSEDQHSAEAAVKTLGGRIESVRDYELPNGDKRRLVLIKKISQTSTKYPRSSANISKKPL